MKVHPTNLPGVLLLEPALFGDERGFFTETYNARDFKEATGLDIQFVQDNHSRSSKGVLRGLHYQLFTPQAKLIRVIRGRVFDVAVDIRRGSPTFGKWAGVELSEDNRLQMWVPVGFAHGFLVLSETADVAYKASDYWVKENERCIRWSDPTIGIDWPVWQQPPTLSERDCNAPFLQQVEVFI
jgi:dTDP-4-dehydrorhamnose 3,5-epimerase